MTRTSLSATVVAAAVILMTGCGRAHRTAANLPDQGRAITSYVRHADAICQRLSGGRRTLTTELLDFAPADAKHVDLSTILRNRRFRRHMDNIADRRQQLELRAERELAALTPPTEVSGIAARWRTALRASFGPTLFEPGLQPDTVELARRRLSAEQADAYATVLGSHDCARLATNSTARFAERITYARLTAYPDNLRPPQEEQGKVAKVLDERTLKLATGQRVRLAGLAEIHGTCGRTYAKAKLQAQTRAGVTVRIEEPRAPASTRALRTGYVYVGATNVNIALLEAGSAIAAREPTYRVYDPFARAAATVARADLRGIWTRCRDDAYAAALSENA